MTKMDASINRLTSDTLVAECSMVSSLLSAESRWIQVKSSAPVLFHLLNPLLSSSWQTDGDAQMQIFWGFLQQIRPEWKTLRTRHNIYGENVRLSAASKRNKCPFWSCFLLHDWTAEINAASELLPGLTCSVWFTETVMKRKIKSKK